MRYYKSILDDGTVFVSTLNADGEGNISEAEYNEIKALLKAMPDGKMLVETESGYEYTDAPTDDDITDEEALAIMIGVSG